MFGFSRAAREREPEQKKRRVSVSRHALAFDARGNRTAWQKGLRVRNSPTCTLSQNGYGDQVARILGRACANGFAENSVHVRVQAWWLNAATEGAAHFADTFALLCCCCRSKIPPPGLEPGSLG